MRSMLAVVQRACCRKACPAQQIACGVELASCGHAAQLRSMFTDAMQCTAMLGCVSGRAQCAATRVCPVLREHLLQESRVPVDVHVGPRRVRDVHAGPRRVREAVGRVPKNISDTYQP